MIDDKKKQPAPKPEDEQEKPVDEKKEPEEEVWDGPKIGEAPKIIDRDDEMYVH